jgi:7,8-dihydropterin-6-yl-methyl-4-(beta-D-ribofuranosyl)aminobenzene 5'-phosphate synthase
LVEINGKRILVDTGDDPGILAKNVKAKGIDLRRLDFVVLAHRNSDHVGGFYFLLSVNPHLKIYAPKENFGIFGSDLPSKFYRKDASLPPNMRYYDGTPPEVMKFGTVFPGANIQLIDKTTEVAPGITLIALVSAAPGTKELKELSLAIDTPDGIVLVVAAALHETCKVDYIAPGHCTGEPTFAAPQKVFGDRYLYAGLGMTLSVGANPRAESDRNAANVLDEGDLLSYQTLLAKSDDLKDSGAEAARFAQIE